MYPYLFDNHMLDMFTIFVLLGIISAMLLFRFLSDKFKLSDEVYNFYFKIILVSIAAGLVGAVIFQQFYNLINSIANGTPYEFKGFTFYGGLITGVGAFVLITMFAAKPSVKKDFWKVLNLAAPSIALAHMLGRFGCFCAGCCHGVDSEQHGLFFKTLGRKVIPTQLYEALFLAILFAVLMLLIFKYRRTTDSIIVYGISYAVFRFVIEFFRGDYRGDFLPVLSPSQWQSLLLLAGAIALAILIYKYKKIPFANTKIPEKSTIDENKSLPENDKEISQQNSNTLDETLKQD